MTTTVQAPVITLPLNGLPDTCPRCGDEPENGQWPITLYGLRLSVLCPRCWTAVAPVMAVAAEDPDCE